MTLSITSVFEKTLPDRLLGGGIADVEVASGLEDLTIGGFDIIPRPEMTAWASLGTGHHPVRGQLML